MIKKAAFIGDSVAAGAGASTPSKRWTTLLSTANGWTEINVAHAQTGYLRAGSKAPCTADSCPASRPPPQPRSAGVDLVIITGGANDLGEDPATAVASVAATLTTLRTGLPNAQIVVVNPWWDMRQNNPALATYTGRSRRQRRRPE